MASKSSNEGVWKTVVGWIAVFLFIGGLLGYNPSDYLNPEILKQKTMLVITDLSDKFGGKLGFPEIVVKQDNVDTSAYLKVSQEWNFDLFPDYYRPLGKSNINTSEFPEKTQITYGKLDGLGRTTTAKGSLTFKNVQGSYGVRQQFTEKDKPTGWLGNETVTVDGKSSVKTYQIDWLNGKSYRGVIWNKSHLIADSLGGHAKTDNIITGTRPQNVGGYNQKGGMRYSEEKAQNYLERHKDTVLYYEAIPVYKDNELVPRAVVVKMLSSDKSIDEAVMTYNTANGYTINYQDGTFTKNK